jgi:hypothetical protein
MEWHLATRNGPEDFARRRVPGRQMHRPRGAGFVRGGRAEPMILRVLDPGNGAVIGESVRLRCRVSYERPSWDDELVWFEVPARHGTQLTQSGNLWLLGLLPLAMSLGERLRVDRPLDSVLFRNSKELMRIWHQWWPHLNPVPIEPTGLLDGAPPSAGLTASFFTAGVDSFFTVFDHDEQVRLRAEPGRQEIDDLLYVMGLDLLLRQEEALRRKVANVNRLASELGKHLVVLATNLRDTKLSTVDYGKYSYGAALGAVGLLLERRYSQVLISSSQHRASCAPTGSCPETDPHMSTAGTRFVHYGDNFTRFEKTCRVAQSELALESLHVCWRGESDTNCGQCEKCYRTMLALEVAGKLAQARCFAGRELSLDKARRIYVPETLHANLIEEVRQAAVSRGRPDVADALAESLRWSRQLGWPRRALRLMGRCPGLKRLSLSWGKKLGRNGLR